MTSTFVGYVGVFLAVFFFGSNFIVTKKFDTGDGFFFQLPFCCGIWTAGLIVMLIRYFAEDFEDAASYDRFYPTAMIGGVIWETGNLMSLPIIARIGMATGLIIWGTSALLVGWFTGYFGLFGLDSERDKIDTLWVNVMGLCLASISLLAAFKIKKKRSLRDGAGDTEEDEDDDPYFYHRSNAAVVENNEFAGMSPLSSPMKKKTKEKIEHLTLQDSLLLGESRNVVAQSRPSSLLSLVDTADEEAAMGVRGDPLVGDDYSTRLKLAPLDGGFFAPMTRSAKAAARARRRHWEGVAMALAAGAFFGSNFDPVTWIKDHDENASQEDLDYVFSHFTGILVTSFVYFLVYCVAKANEPWVSKTLILPAFVSGLCWAVAQIGWFLANGSLGYTTSFPLVLIGPGFVGSMWDVLVFREIKGRRNMIWLTIVFVLIASSATCTVLSRSD
eukprot:g2999.t1